MQEVLAPEFDYSLLDSETRIVVQQRTSEIRSLMGKSAEIVREIGQKLIEIKTRLGHGPFGEWLGHEFGWTHRTADRYMLVASKFDNLSNLELASPSALYLLAADSTPEEVKETAIAQIESGEKVTHKQVKDAIKTATIKAGDVQEVVEESHPLYGQTVTVKEVKGDIARCEVDGETVAIARGWLSGEAEEVQPTTKPSAPKPQLSTLLEDTEMALDIARKRIELLQQYGQLAQSWIDEVCGEFELPEPSQTKATQLRENAIALGLIE